MQLKQNMPMPRKDNDISENFESYKNKEYISEKQNIEKDYRDLIDKSLNTGSHTRDGLLRRTS